MIRGVAYPSRLAAAKALGVRPECIYRHAAKGTLDKAGLGRQTTPPVVTTPSVIRGVSYASDLEAAEALGVSSKTISMARARGTLEGVGLGRVAHNKKRGKPVTIDGVEYISRAEAARQLGIPYHTVVSL